MAKIAPLWMRFVASFLAILLADPHLYAYSPNNRVLRFTATINSNAFTLPLQTGVHYIGETEGRSGEVWRRVNTLVHPKNLGMRSFHTVRTALLLAVRALSVEVRTTNPMFPSLNLAEAALLSFTSMFAIHSLSYLFSNSLDAFVSWGSFGSVQRMGVSSPMVAMLLCSAAKARANGLVLAKIQNWISQARSTLQGIDTDEIEAITDAALQKRSLFDISGTRQKVLDHFQHSDPKRKWTSQNMPKIVFVSTDDKVRHFIETEGRSRYVSVVLPDRSKNVLYVHFDAINEYLRQNPMADADEVLKEVIGHGLEHFDRKYRCELSQPEREILSGFRVGSSLYDISTDKVEKIRALIGRTKVVSLHASLSSMPHIEIPANITKTSSRNRLNWLESLNLSQWSSREYLEGPFNPLPIQLKSNAYPITKLYQYHDGKSQVLVTPNELRLLNLLTKEEYQADVRNRRESIKRSNETIMNLRHVVRFLSEPDLVRYVLDKFPQSDMDKARIRGLIEMCLHEEVFLTADFQQSGLFLNDKFVPFDQTFIDRVHGFVIESAQNGQVEIPIGLTLLPSMMSFERQRLRAMHDARKGRSSVWDAIATFIDGLFHETADYLMEALVWGRAVSLMRDENRFAGMPQNQVRNVAIIGNMGGMSFRVFGVVGSLLSNLGFKPEDKTYSYLDFSKPMVEKAIEIAAKLGLKVTGLHQNANQPLPFSDSSLQCVRDEMSLEFGSPEEEMAYIEELHRVIQAGGYLITTGRRDLLTAARPIMMRHGFTPITEADTFPIDERSTLDHLRPTSEQEERLFDHTSRNTYAIYVKTSDPIAASERVLSIEAFRAIHKVRVTRVRTVARRLLGGKSPANVTTPSSLGGLHLEDLSADDVRPTTISRWTLVDDQSYIDFPEKLLALVWQAHIGGLSPRELKRLQQFLLVWKNPSEQVFARRDIDFVLGRVLRDPFKDPSGESGRNQRSEPNAAKSVLLDSPDAQEGDGEDSPTSIWGLYKSLSGTDKQNLEELYRVDVYAPMDFMKTPETMRHETTPPAVAPSASSGPDGDNASGEEHLEIRAPKSELPSLAPVEDVSQMEGFFSDLEGADDIVAAGQVAEEEQPPAPEHPKPLEVKTEQPTLADQLMELADLKERESISALQEADRELSQEREIQWNRVVQHFEMAQKTALAHLEVCEQGFVVDDATPAQQRIFSDKVRHIERQLRDILERKLSLAIQLSDIAPDRKYLSEAEITEIHEWRRGLRQNEPQKFRQIDLRIEEIKISLERRKEVQKILASKDLQTSLAIHDIVLLARDILKDPWLMTTFRDILPTTLFALLDTNEKKASFMAQADEINMRRIIDRKSNNTWVYQIEKVLRESIEDVDLEEELRKIEVDAEPQISFDQIDGFLEKLKNIQSRIPVAIITRHLNPQKVEDSIQALGEKVLSGALTIIARTIDSEISNLPQTLDPEIALSRLSVVNDAINKLQALRGKSEQFPSILLSIDESIGLAQEIRNEIVVAIVRHHLSGMELRKESLADMVAEAANQEMDGVVKTLIRTYPDLISYQFLIDKTVREEYGVMVVARNAAVISHEDLSERETLWGKLLKELNNIFSKNNLPLLNERDVERYFGSAHFRRFSSLPKSELDQMVQRRILPEESLPTALLTLHLRTNFEAYTIFSKLFPKIAAEVTYESIDSDTETIYLEIDRALSELRFFEKWPNDQPDKRKVNRAFADLGTVRLNSAAGKAWVYLIGNKVTPHFAGYMQWRNRQRGAPSHSAKANGWSYLIRGHWKIFMAGIGAQWKGRDGTFSSEFSLTIKTYLETKGITSFRLQPATDPWWKLPLGAVRYEGDSLIMRLKPGMNPLLAVEIISHELNHYVWHDVVVAEAQNHLGYRILLRLPIVGPSLSKSWLAHREESVVIRKTNEEMKSIHAQMTASPFGALRVLNRLLSQPLLSMSGMIALLLSSTSPLVSAHDVMTAA